MATTMATTMASDRYQLEFKVGFDVREQGYMVGAFIDGQLKSYRGPFKTTAEAKDERDRWVAELEAKAADYDEDMSRILLQ
jgi:hypothetical protein